MTKATEIWECCTFELWMMQGTRRKLPSLDAAVSPRQGDDGYIVNHRFIMKKIISYLTNTLCQLLKTFLKDPGLSNFPCPFTSRSSLFALTTDLPGPADGPLNIVQGNILAS